MARRVAFTLGALLVYRFGTSVPIPGISRTIWEQSLRAGHGGLLAIASYSSGGGRLSVFCLGITPYMTAAVLMQLAAMVSSRLRMLAERGEAGRRKFVRYTLVLTAVLAASQAFGIAFALGRMRGVAADPDVAFTFPAAATILAGVFFLVWLSEQITARGIGNGVSLLLCTGAVLEVPGILATLVQQGQIGALSVRIEVAIVALTLALIGLIVFVESGRLLIPVQVAAPPAGYDQAVKRSAFLTLKLNNGGLIPAVVGPWLIFSPLAFIGLAFGSPSWFSVIAVKLSTIHSLHIVVSLVAILAFSFVYTAFVLDPEVIAAKLGRFAAVVPNVEPGDATAGYIDKVVSRVTLLGAAYLALVFLIPEALVAWTKVPLYLNGASALIMVCTVLDVKAQVRGYWEGSRGLRR